MVQPKSSLVKMTLKEVNDAWLNVVLKSFDGKEQIKEMSMKLLSSDELRQDDSKVNPDLIPIIYSNCAQRAL